MKDLIIKNLEKIETSAGVRILFACESGSRAWGFPSPDSDYDIRIIYLRPVDWYLSIQEGKDVLEFPIKNDLDVSGWDLKKTLGLILKSNPVVWEWLQSPVVYMQRPGFKKALLKAANSHFSPKTGFNHYFSHTKKTYEDLNKNHFRLKKIFYVIRPLLAARWIAEKKSVPPMEIDALLEVGWVLPEEKAFVKELVEKKSKVKESFAMAGNPELQNFIEKNMRACGELSTDIESSKGEIEELNTFFRNELKRDH